MRSIVCALSLITFIVAAKAEQQVRSQKYGSALICSRDVAPQDCDAVNAIEVKKVVCGGAGFAMGIAQVADSELGQTIDPERQYLKIICTIGNRVPLDEVRAERR